MLQPSWSACYSPPLSAHHGSDPLGGYCQPGHNGQQTGENPCGLHLPYPPTDRSGPVRLFRRGMPVLMAGDLNGKHADWNSRLSTRRGKLLRDYADGNCSLIFGPDTPTNNSYNALATPDVLDNVITKNLTSPVYLTSFSVLTSDHLPILIETTCRSFFQHPPDRPDFRRTDWAKFQTHLEDQIPFDPELHDGMAIETCVENFSGAVRKALAASTPKRRQRADPRPPIPAGIQEEIRVKNRLRRQWQITRESRSQTNAEVSDPPAQRVEERRVECHIRIPRSRRPVAVDDSQAGDEFLFRLPLLTPGNHSLRL